MAVNVFEGARRIAKLTSALWIVGWLIAALFFPPTPSSNVSVTYSIAGPGKVPTRIEESKCNDDGKEVLRVETKKGNQAFIVLCFYAEKATDGARFYRYSVDQLGPWTSPEVVEYTKRTKGAYVLPPSDEAWIDAQFRHKLRIEFGWWALAAAIGLIFLWVFSSAVGWIARGFLGIPKGQDSPDSSKETLR